MLIHPTAIIDPKAELADDVEVQAYSIVGPEVKVGAGTVIGSHCVLTGRTEIGCNNRLYSSSHIGVVSQDLKHKHFLIGRTIIGDGNIFRENSTVSASTMTSYDDDHRVTSIGDNCMFMANSHVAHDCHVGNHVILANCASLSGHVDVEDFAILGGLSGVHQECVVGTQAFVGGLCRVAKDVPPYMIVDGNPGRCCGPNTVGLKRRGYTTEQRSRIKELYKIMYRSNLNTTQALHEIETRIEESEERTRFLEFVRRSIRGITSR
jgi:UDP-N-acetylglucosamine acyltransferase